MGAKPTDPWTAMDVAQRARKHLRLQNTIHWIKSIAIDREAAGAGADMDRDIAVGHYKPINSERFVNDCHEFVFHFTPHGTTPLDRLSIGVPYQDPSNISRWRRGGGNRRCRGNTWFIPYETIQSRDKDRPHPATFPPRLAEKKGEQAPCTSRCGDGNRKGRTAVEGRGVSPCALRLCACSRPSPWGSVN